MTKQEAFEKATKLASEVIKDEDTNKFCQIHDICYENDLFMLEDIRDEEGNLGFMIEDECYYFKG